MRTNIHPIINDLCGKLCSSLLWWPQPSDMPDSGSMKRFVRPTILAGIAKGVRSAMRNAK